AQETAGRGDIDRLMTEWRSLLRQIAAAPPIQVEAEEVDAERNRDRRDAALFLAERWDNLRALARSHLAEARMSALPDLPPLTADQRRPVNHRFMKVVRS
ncbi:MAG TPA: hypothetical protein PKX00_13740, partial [Opitutaceae bacterium]|nr:hypothetical protein [Opitutaceae bacterium]